MEICIFQNILKNVQPQPLIPDTNTPIVHVNYSRTTLVAATVSANPMEKCHDLSRQYSTET